MASPAGMAAGCFPAWAQPGQHPPPGHFMHPHSYAHGQPPINVSITVGWPQPYAQGQVQVPHGAPGAHVVLGACEAPSPAAGPEAPAVPNHHAQHAAAVAALPLPLTPLHLRGVNEFERDLRGATFGVRFVKKSGAKAGLRRFCVVSLEGEAQEPVVAPLGAPSNPQNKRQAAVGSADLPEPVVRPLDLRAAPRFATDPFIKHAFFCWRSFRDEQGETVRLLTLETLAWRSHHRGTRSLLPKDLAGLQGAEKAVLEAAAAAEQAGAAAQEGGAEEQEHAEEGDEEEEEGEGGRVVKAAGGDEVEGFEMVPSEGEDEEEEGGQGGAAQLPGGEGVQAAAAPKVLFGWRWLKQPGSQGRRFRVVTLEPRKARGAKCDVGPDADVRMGGQ